MPTIKKQVAKPVVRKAKGGVAGRISPVKQVDSGGIHISLYGRSKTGKTRLISTFPKPVLIIGAEDGTRSIRNVDKVDFVKIERSSEVIEVIDEAVGMGYQTVALDTASALADMVLAEILGIERVPPQSSWGLASREQYGQQALQLKTILRSILDLPTHVVVTAHERNFNEESSSDLIIPTVGSALSPSVTGWLNGAAEYICQTFIREREVIRKVTVAGKVTKMKTKDGSAEYCLRVGPHPVYMTGFRLPPGFTLPELIVDPTYEKINKIIQGGN